MPSMVWWILRALPPNWSSFSRTMVSKPWSPRLRAAFSPATPPPMTTARWLMVRGFSSSGLSSEARATAMRTRSLALSVAFSGSFMCTQESWLRMLAISKRYLLSPASIMVSRNSGSWVMGVQAATTTRLSCCSLMTLVMFTWVSWEQVKRFSSVKTTLGNVLA